MKGPNAFSFGALGMAQGAQTLQRGYKRSYKRVIPGTRLHTCVIPGSFVPGKEFTTYTFSGVRLLCRTLGTAALPKHDPNAFPFLSRRKCS